MTFKQTLTLATTTLGLSLGIVGAAQAALLVNVTGTSGSGETTWTFSGSSTASFSSTFGTDASSLPNTFFNIGDYTSIEETTFIATSSNTTITTGSGTESITSLYLDFDSSTGDDDFGFGLANSLGVSSGDNVSWSGTLTLAVDIDQLNLGTYGPATTGAPAGLSDIQLTISEGVQTTPEPGTLLGLIGVGLLGVVTRKRK